MSELLCVVWAILAALVGLGVGGAATYALLRRHDRLSVSGAQNRVQELLDNAKKEAENLYKEAELRAKDELFRQKEEFNKEAEQIRSELRDQERRLDKREDALDSRQQV